MSLPRPVNKQDRANLLGREVQLLHPVAPLLHRLEQQPVLVLEGHVGPALRRIGPAPPTHALAHAAL